MADVLYHSRSLVRPPGPFKCGLTATPEPAMRPLSVLLGIVLGSTVSITVALALTLLVFLLLPEYSGRIGEEFPPLLRTLGGSALLAVVSAAGFYGELRERSWRRWPQWLLATLLVLLGWWVWPTE